MQFQQGHDRELENGRAAHSQAAPLCVACQYVGQSRPVRASYLSGESYGSWLPEAGLECYCDELLEARDRRSSDRAGDREDSSRITIVKKPLIPAEVVQGVMILLFSAFSIFTLIIAFGADL